MSASPARFNGTCINCGKPIVGTNQHRLGQYIHWDRTVKGRAWHANCADPDSIPPDAVNVPAPQFHPQQFLNPAAPIEASIQAQIQAAIQAAIQATLVQRSPAAPVTGEYAVPVPVPVPAKPLTPESEWFDVFAVLMAWVMTTRKYLRILLLGPPGTGKSKTSELLAKAIRKPLHPKQAVEDLVGMFHLVKGETVFRPVYVTSCMQSGRYIVLDELDQTSNEVQSAAHSFMDDEPHVALMTGEIIKGVPGYGVIGTTNAAVTAFTEAILDRIDVILPALTAHPGALATLEPEQKDYVINDLKGRSPATWQFSRRGSPRTMRNFNMLKPVLGEHWAAQVTFGNASRDVLAGLETASRSRKEKLATNPNPNQNPGTEVSNNG